MWICKYCKKEYDFVSTPQKANHTRWCIDNPVKYKIKSNTIEKMNESKKKSGFINHYEKARILNLPIPKGKPSNSLKGKHHSENTKKLMSEKRKEYLKNNPDKHPWKNHKKFKSVPCEHFKQKLIEANISFLPEYEPLENRHFSIDIAFPDKKIGIEINGNQHYNSDGTLTEYCLNRKQLIESQGWKLFDYHYALVFNNEFINEVINSLKTDFNLGEIDYSKYIKPKKETIITICPKCGLVKKYKYSILCNKCNNESRKLYPDKHGITKELLEKLILEKSFCEIARMFNISDNAIRKKCKKFNILIPKKEPGYWD